MGKHRTENTLHSYERAITRCGWNKKQAREMMLAASRRGLSPLSIEPGELRDFLLSRQINTNRRVKFYKGYVFVFASTSTKCFTVYPLDINSFSEEERIKIEKLMKRT